jgi:hypothetical protein
VLLGLEGVVLLGQLAISGNAGTFITVTRVTGAFRVISLLACSNLQGTVRLDRWDIYIYIFVRF